MRRATVFVATAAAVLALGAGPGAAEGPPLDGGVEALPERPRQKTLALHPSHFDPGTTTVDCSNFPTCDATSTDSLVVQGIGRATLTRTETWHFTGDCGPDTIQFDFEGFLVVTAQNGDEAFLDTEGEFCANFVTETGVFRCETFTPAGGTGRLDNTGNPVFTVCS